MARQYLLLRCTLGDFKMSDKGPHSYPVVFNTDDGLQYSFESGYIAIPESPANAITGLTGDVAAGTGPGAVASTLATVNSNVGSFTNANITVNGKGLVTAAANGTAPTTYTAGSGLSLTGGAFSLTVAQPVLPSVVDSGTYASGAATITPLVAGLLTSSTIWSVTQVTPGASNLPILGFSNTVNGRINILYLGDPSTGVKVRVVFK
jgi:hypothetical protein